MIAYKSRPTTHGWFHNLSPHLQLKVCSDESEPTKRTELHEGIKEPIADRGAYPIPAAILGSAAADGSCNAVK